jgi:hypothetical protein
MKSKKRLATLVIALTIVLYCGSFLLLPMKIAILFYPGLTVTEQQADKLLPSVRGSVELKKIGSEPRVTYTFITKTINILAILKERELQESNYFPLIFATFSQALPQDYPYQFQNYLYYPLWWVVNNYLI